jgi:sec-independent protein translocase protein TatA
MGSSLVSPTHLILLALACLLLFGAKRLPEIGRSLGAGMREFKTSVTGDDADATPSGPLPAALLPSSAAATPTVAIPTELAPTSAATAREGATGSASPRPTR